MYKRKKLTLRQQKFCDEYIISGNANQSAINAGYSEKYAKSDSYKLLENTGIKAYISEKQEKFVDKVNQKIDEIKLLDNNSIVKIKDTLISIYTSNEPIFKIFHRYKKNKKTNEKELIWIEETKEDNRFLKIKAIDSLLKFQMAMLTTKEKLKILNSKVENIELKNKEMKYKVENLETEKEEGYLDGVTGVEIVEEHENN